MSHDALIMVLAIALDLVKWPLFLILLVAVCFQIWLFWNVIREIRR